MKNFLFNFRFLFNVPRRNQSMNFQLWKFGRIDGKKQLHTIDCGVLFLAMTMKISTKENIFDSLLATDLKY